VKQRIVRERRSHRQVAPVFRPGNFFARHREFPFQRVETNADGPGRSEGCFPLGKFIAEEGADGFEMGGRQVQRLVLDVCWQGKLLAVGWIKVRNEEQNRIVVFLCIMLYPYPDITRQFLERIPEHLYRLDYEEVQIDCNHNLPGVPTCVVDFTNEPFFLKQRDSFKGDNFIYRARQIDNPGNVPFENVSDISYVPKEKWHKIKRGRVNKPQESMFYGALDSFTACTESITKGKVLQTQRNVMLVVGKWKFRNPLRFVQMPYSEKYFRLFWSRGGEKSETIQLHHIEKLNEETRVQMGNDFNYEVLQFFSDEFARFDTSDDYHYMLSNYYADRVFNRIPGFYTEEEVHGILYPSIALSYQHKNLVLTPQVADEHLEFVSASIVWMVYHNDGSVNTYPMKYGVSADNEGKLLWQTTGIGRW
jgi:hypothetical protein